LTGIIKKMKLCNAALAHHDGNIILRVKLVYWRRGSKSLLVTANYHFINDDIGVPFYRYALLFILCCLT
jgi:hypothetical protein